MSTPTLQLRNIAKFYGAVRALNNINMTIDAGSVVALVGDNGAGKSTLVKAISGAAPADEGSIEFEGTLVTIGRPSDASALGIATVFQDLALCDNLDIVANLFLGRPELTKSGRFVGWRDEVAMEQKAKELLDSLSVKLKSIRALVADLSGGQRQSIAIARSLLGSPRLIILDEPTAALGVSQTAQVLELIRRLKSQGHAVLFISHNLRDVFEVCDRIEVLRLGSNAGSFDVASTTPAQIVSAMTGADLAEKDPLANAEAGIATPNATSIAR